MTHDIFQAEIDYYTALGIKVEVVEVEDHRWIRHENGWILNTIVHNDKEAFKVMKYHRVMVEFFPDRVEAMAYDGTTPISVYYDSKGYMSDSEVCNLAILYAATNKLMEEAE